MLPGKRVGKTGAVLFPVITARCQIRKQKMVATHKPGCVSLKRNWPFLCLAKPNLWKQRWDEISFYQLPLMFCFEVVVVFFKKKKKQQPKQLRFINQIKTSFPSLLVAILTPLNYQKKQKKTLAVDPAATGAEEQHTLDTSPVACLLFRLLRPPCETRKRRTRLLHPIYSSQRRLFVLQLCPRSTPVSNQRLMHSFLHP